MNISLILAPFWGSRYPSLALALLSAILKNKGHTVRSFDLDRHFQVRHHKKHKHLWDEYNILIRDQSTAQRFMRKYHDFFDAHIRKILQGHPRLIGFSIYNSTYPVSLCIARRIRELDKKVKIVFGGPECFHRGEEFVKERCIDYAVPGEADEIISELAGLIARGGAIGTCKGVWYKKKGHALFTGERKAITALDDLPFPDYTGMLGLYATERQRYLPIQSSRGCIRRCAFCNIGVIQKKYRHMSAARIFAEITHGYTTYGISNFIFNDNLINGDIAVLERVCDLLIAFRLDVVSKTLSQPKTSHTYPVITWGGHAIIRPEMTPALLTKMKRAGCHTLVYGIESGSQKVVDAMQKQYSIALAKEVLRNTAAAGIIANIYLLIGFPTETDADFAQTLLFLKDMKKSVTTVTPSKSFCAIIKDSGLDRYPQRFAINKKDHDIFWESAAHGNTYPVRNDRYAALCTFAKKQRITLAPAPSSVRKDYAFLLDEYNKYSQKE